MGLWSATDVSDWRLETSASGLEALERVDSGNIPSLILLDLVPGDGEALHTLRWLRRVAPTVPVIVLADPEDNGQMMEAVRLGAENYILKPCRAEDLTRILRRHVPMVQDARPSALGSPTIETLGDNRFFISASQASRRLRARALLLAQVNVPVLITGESGSGRETTARLVHKLSVRSGFQFAKVNCSVLPAEILERELWGAQSSASSMLHPEGGKLHDCRQGTLLLDEIDSLPDHVQSRLLALFQETHATRRSGEMLANVGARILASTSVDAQVLVATGRLREDLWNWLSTFVLQVPSVRERREEIPMLIEHFMGRLSKRYGLPQRPLSPALLEACRAYPWPGNLREMETFVKRYLVMGNESQARLELRGGPVSEAHSEVVSSEAKKESLVSQGETNGDKPGLKSLLRSVKGETERTAIARALDETHWNRKAAARLLSISYRALLYKIQHYQLTPPDSYLSNVGFDSGAKGTSHGD